MAMDSYYVLSLNILKALGGDVSITYPDADSIWVEINKIYNNAGNRFDIAPLEKIITENGEYNYYPDNNIDAFTPVNISVNIPQKYTDEQVFELEQLAESKGYIRGYDEGEEYGKLTGREEGYTEGFNSGVDAGQLVQKNKLTNITIVENGVYEKEDGYNVVTVEVAAGVTDEEVETLVNAARKEGYRDGYTYGVDDGITYQKNKLGTTTFRDNGNYTSEDGWNNVTVEVDIPEFETEQLNVELKENKNYTYTPTTNGFSSVNISVNVPSSGGGDSTGLDLVAMGFTADDQTEWDNENNDRIARAQSLAQRLVDNFPTINPTNVFFDYIKDALDGGKLNGNTDLIVFPSITNRYSGSWNCDGAFRNCVNLVKVGNIGGGSYNDIGFASNMFENCINLEAAPKLLLNEGYFNFMFKGCTKLKDVSNLSYSGTYGIQTGNMFENCVNLEAAPNIRTSYPSGMFKGCIKLKDVSKFSVYLDKLTGSRHSFAETFMNCTSLETFPNVGSSNQSIGRAVNYISMFEGCTKLNTTSKFSVDVSTSNSQNYNFNRMFYNCTSLTQPVISSITNNKGTAHTASYMYYYCESLQTAASFNFANFKDISYMYSYCKSLTSIPKMDCGKIEICNSFASSCSALTTLGGFTNLGQKANLTGTDWMLRYCSALTRDSILNVFNNLYDRASAGYSVLTFHINSTPLALLSEDDIAIATNKGWTISS
jgi:hypothetical protein